MMYEKAWKKPARAAIQQWIGQHMLGTRTTPCAQVMIFGPQDVELWASLITSREQWEQLRETIPEAGVKVVLLDVAAALQQVVAEEMAEAAAPSLTRTA